MGNLSEMLEPKKPIPAPGFAHGSDPLLGVRSKRAQGVVADDTGSIARKLARSNGTRIFGSTCGKIENEMAQLPRKSAKNYACGSPV
jgi:hypothetical protein